ncbi:MAG: flavin reductase family protein [Armatimonadetes bacterium]|nr:flavin reductase family protein [Armatimonadota bacterium]
MRTLNLSELGSTIAYHVLTNLVVPRPIAFVSTLSADGVANLAPFSYFNIGGMNPPSLVFCPVLDGEGNPKDSLKNIKETGEFVVNLVNREMAEGMNAASYTFPPDASEWEPSGFHPLASQSVKPKRVAESPVQLECRLFQVVKHGDGPSSACYVIGEVVLAHLADELMDGDVILPLSPISRLGGPDYLDLATGERFSLPRPTGD